MYIYIYNEKKPEEKKMNSSSYLRQFIDQLRALKGQQENCTYMNKQYAQ